MYIQQFKLFLPSSLDARHHLSLIASERDILLVNIPVAGFQLLDQPAFRYLPVPDQPVISDIIGQRCDQELSKPKHYPKNIVFYSVNHSVIG